MHTKLHNRTAIITQARTTSTRLPAKILKKINGQTLLDYHLNRLKWSNLPIIVATTTNTCDDSIVDICKTHSINVFRGDEHNVLSRYYYAAKQFQLNIIIRVCSDCPLIDGTLIKNALDEFSNCDYLSNTINSTFPLGFNFEIFTFNALEEAYLNATETPEKEHVTPYIYRNHSDLFKIKHFSNNVDASHYRLTVDTDDDFTLIKSLITDYQCGNKNIYDIVDVLNRNPLLENINSHIQQKQYGE